MKRAIVVFVAIAAFAAIGVLTVRKPELSPLRQIGAAPVGAQATGAVIYYRDPDGLPSYSLTPKKTPDGRDYQPVAKEADVNFDLAEEAPPAADTPKERR